MSIHMELEEKIGIMELVKLVFEGIWIQKADTGSIEVWTKYKYFNLVIFNFLDRIFPIKHKKREERLTIEKVRIPYFCKARIYKLKEITHEKNVLCCRTGFYGSFL